ncbi:MAG: hypothetical protein NC411_02210 [Bacteroides sp.]|nr:hypothetical protein [Bacteroides sp.]
MKYLPYILLILLICACNPAAKRNEAILIEAERLMNEHPDSSLSLLLSVDTAALGRNETRRALYGLLLTQAQFKNSIIPTDDSLINAAKRFYEWSDDKRHSMLANYYYARMRLNANDYSKSLFSFFNSYEQALSLDDKFWIAMNAERICEIYRYTYNYKEMMRFAKIEYQNFKEHGNPLYIHDGLLDVAMGYHYNEKYDSALSIYSQLIDSAHKHNDNELLIYVLRKKGISHLMNSQYDSALYYNRLVANAGYAGAIDSAFLGLTLHRMDSIDRAKEIMNQISAKNFIGNWELRHDVYLSLDSLKEALEASDSLIFVLNNVIGDNINQNLIGSLSDFHHYSVEIEKEKYRYARLVTWFIVFAAVVIIIFFGLISVYRIHRQREQIEKNVSLAMNLKEMMEANDTKINTVILSMLGDRFKILDELCKLVYESPNQTHARRKISQEIESMINQYSKDEKKLNELEAYADKHYHGLMSSFRNDFPNLIPNDYLLFLYSIYGFSNPSIALFLGLDNVSKVYDRRKRLKNKIRSFDGENGSIYLKILS